MAGADRRPAPALSAAGPPPAVAAGDARALLARLVAEPWRFDFFQALRVIEAAHPDRPPLGRGRRATDEPVRLGQPPELGFPPAELLRVEPDASGRLRVAQRVLGLFGPHGALPLWVTARARAQARQEADATLAAFVDLFHHRLVALYYRAWAEARPAVEQDRGPASRTTARLAALVGLGLGGSLDRLGVPGRYLLHVAGLLLLGSRPPEALERVLALYLLMPVRVLELQAAWLEVPERWRGRLGAARLGESSVLGQAVHARTHRFRVRLGPMGRADLEALLPDGELLRAVLALVHLMQGRELDLDLQLVVRREEVPAARLDGRTRLAWTSWLHVAARARDADDLVLERPERRSGQGDRAWR
jgi:type VI secretion system protein ImpH